MELGLVKIVFLSFIIVADRGSIGDIHISSTIFLQQIGVRSLTLSLTICVFSAFKVTYYLS